MLRANGNSRLIPSVGYLRRSTDKQEGSIPDQTTAIQKYAKANGYQIVEWYKDDAITGDSIEERPGFWAMREDAASGRFKAILCWDQSRFGRFDSIDAGWAIKPIRDAGVSLVLVDEGPQDWDSFTGRVMFGMKQEGKHDFLKALARDVTRGQLEAAKAGSWIGSKPYGYQITGKRKQKRLALDDDSTKAKTVQRIFREYVVDGSSMNEIANRLQSDGIPSPGGRGKRWRFDTVRIILLNRAYVGDYTGCRESNGKYHTVSHGAVVKSNGKRYRKPETDWVIHLDHHPALVDRETFAKAQAILAKGKSGRSPHREGENPYPLTGLLRCGRCGSPLWGIHNRKFKYYECSRRKYEGGSACDGTTVREDVVLLSIGRYLENWLGFDGEALGAAAFYDALKDGDLPEAFAEVKKLVMPPARPKPKQDRKPLAKELADAKATLVKWRHNLIDLDGENRSVALERIRQLDLHQLELEAELRQVKTQGPKDINKIVRDVMGTLYSLAGCCKALAKPVSDQWDFHGSLEAAAPKALRRLLHQGYIVCNTTKHGEGTATRHILEPGEIVFGVGGVTGNLNPHPPD